MSAAYDSNSWLSTESKLNNQRTNVSWHRRQRKLLTGVKSVWWRQFDSYYDGIIWTLLADCADYDSPLKVLLKTQTQTHTRASQGSAYNIEPIIANAAYRCVWWWRQRCCVKRWGLGAASKISLLPCWCVCMYVCMPARAFVCTCACRCAFVCMCAGVSLSVFVCVWII
jgi:hypothetical protein